MAWQIRDQCHMVYPVFGIDKLGIAVASDLAVWYKRPAHGTVRQLRTQAA